MVRWKETYRRIKSAPKLTLTLDNEREVGLSRWLVVSHRLVQSLLCCCGSVICETEFFRIFRVIYEAFQRIFQFWFICDSYLFIYCNYELIQSKIMPTIKTINFGITVFSSRFLFLLDQQFSIVRRISILHPRLSLICPSWLHIPLWRLLKSLSSTSSRTPYLKKKTYAILSNITLTIDVESPYLYNSSDQQQRV